MADDKSNRGPQDRTRINVKEDYELRQWTERFDITPEELKSAVATVGPSVEAVERHLKGDLSMERSTNSECQGDAEFGGLLLISTQT